jgi:hypothetical protein
LRNFSSCFTREFVAIGRGVNDEGGAGEYFDGFLDVFVTTGFGCGSMNRTVGVGPLFGTLLLNCECLECTGVRTSMAVEEMKRTQVRKSQKRTSAGRVAETSQLLHQGLGATLRKLAKGLNFIYLL